MRIHEADVVTLVALMNARNSRTGEPEECFGEEIEYGMVRHLPLYASWIKG
jgi:hypothetical protein